MSKKNAEEDYITTPISVLAYITELEAERDALQAKLDLIDLKFKSGNSIPVERITVKRDEFYKLEGKGDE